MQVFVTGNRGYIASHLPAKWAGHGCDIKDGVDYRDIRGHEFDVVVHLAASVSVTESFLEPQAYLENNALGLIPFLQNNKIRKFILASTGGAMYGDKILAKEEDARIENCASPYAKSKFIAESIVSYYCPDYVILRLANVYGGMSTRGEANVHTHFVRDNPITVYGGDQTRDFIYVVNVCNAIHIAAASPLRGVFNIGSGRETEVAGLARHFGRERRVSVVTEAARPGEVNRISLDISKAEAAGLL